MRIVVVTGDGADASATREVAAVSQGMTAQQQEPHRQGEPATREAAQAAAAAGREAARAAQPATTPQGTERTEMPGVPAPPSPAAPPHLVIEQRDGRKIVIGPGAHPAASGTMAQTGDPDLQLLMPQIPVEAVVISIAFFVMLALISIGVPLARAYARRMDRQAAGGGAAAFPTDVSDRIERIEHAVEAIAIEVERVSEGQRFTTKLLSELRTPLSVGAGAQRP